MYGVNILLLSIICQVFSIRARLGDCADRTTLWFVISMSGGNVQYLHSGGEKTSRIERDKWLSSVRVRGVTRRGAAPRVQSWQRQEWTRSVRPLYYYTVCVHLLQSLITLFTLSLVTHDLRTSETELSGQRSWRHPLLSTGWPVRLREMLLWV